MDNCGLRLGNPSNTKMSSTVKISKNGGPPRGSKPGVGLGFDPKGIGKRLGKKKKKKADEKKKASTIDDRGVGERMGKTSIRIVDKKKKEKKGKPADNGNGVE